MLIPADRVHRYNSLPFADLCDGRGGRNGVADVYRSGEGQGLRKIHDLSFRKFISEHGRNKRPAQHSMRDPPAKAGRRREVVIEMDRIMVAGDLGERPHQFVRHMPLPRKGIAYLNVNIHLC